jgi:hypothetical protein
MFTLDQTTLHYYSLSDSNGNSNGEKFLSGINSWAAAIPRNGKPSSNATSKTGTGKTGTKSSRGDSILPPLTEATTHSSTNSVLMKNVTISQPAPVKVKLEANNARISIVDGVLSDEDETNGIEQDAAAASPPKGKKCATSSVSNIFDIIFCLTKECCILGSRKGVANQGCPTSC